MRRRITLLMLLITFVDISCRKESNISRNEVDIYYQSISNDYSLIKNDTSYYDLNNDNIADLEAIRHTDTLLDKELRCAGKIFSLNDTMKFTYMRIKPITAMLDTLDIIDTSGNLSWTDTLQYVGNRWQGIFTPNFGFQVKKKGINYGWFHFNTGLLSEIAFNRIQNSPIRMKQKK